VCDLGQTLFWGKTWAWWGTAVMFVLNNTFIQALHVLVGAEYLNTMTENTSIGGCRTVEFSVVVAVICWLASLPRTFSMMSKLGTASALFTLISVVLATAFSVVQGKPAGYSPELGEPIVTAIPLRSTTFVQGMAAFLNISYTFIGQITLPSFIAEMRDPRYVFFLFMVFFHFDPFHFFPFLSPIISQIISFFSSSKHPKRPRTQN